MCIRDSFNYADLTDYREGQITSLALIRSKGVNMTILAFDSEQLLPTHQTPGPVSYTHLDVYKRQDRKEAFRSRPVTASSLMQGKTAMKNRAVVSGKCRETAFYFMEKHPALTGAGSGRGRSSGKRMIRP